MEPDSCGPAALVTPTQSALIDFRLSSGKSIARNGGGPESQQAHNSDKGFKPSPKKLSVSVASTVRVPVEMVAITRTPGFSG